MEAISPELLQKMLDELREYIAGAKAKDEKSPEIMIPLKEAISRQLVDIRDTKYTPAELLAEEDMFMPDVYVGSVETVNKLLAVVNGMGNLEALSALELAKSAVRSASEMEPLRTDSPAMRRGLSQALLQYSGIA